MPLSPVEMAQNTMDGSAPQVSVVFPVYNEEGNLELLYQRVHDAISIAGVSYEMVFVDNGSTDGSLQIIKGLSKRDASVRHVSLSRNFGHQAGLFAGMRYSRGHAVVTMDADLQHPPTMLPEMIYLWQQGYQVVYTTKRNYNLSKLKSIQVKTFYWVLSKVSGLNLSFGQSDFRLLDRKVVDTLLEIPEYRKFLRGMVEWVGFKRAGLEYDVSERHSGQSKFSYRSLVSFALDGILAFSSLPLRWMLLVGVVVALLSVAYAGVALTLGLLDVAGRGPSLPPGWASLAAAVAFFGGIQLIAVGVVGEYVGRIYDQTKGRPTFIVRETSESASDELSEARQTPWPKR